MIPIGRLISPLVFIEDKVIQILVFSVVQNCICYVFYSVSPRFLGRLTAFFDLL